MKIIVFGSGQNELIKTLEKMIHRQLPSVETRCVGSLERLSRDLCRPLNQIDVIIMLVSSKKETLRMLGLTTLMDNIRLILVMGENDSPSMRSLAIQLGPSFIGVSNHLDDVVTVLERIVRRIVHLKRHVYSGNKHGRQESR